MARPRTTAELSLVDDSTPPPEVEAPVEGPVEAAVEAPAAEASAAPEAVGVTDVRALALKHGPEAIAALVKIINEGASEASRIAAANALLDRAYGKARQASAPVEPPEETRLTVMFV